MEVELGEFFNNGGNDDEVEVSPEATQYHQNRVKSKTLIFCINYYDFEYKVFFSASNVIRIVFDYQND